MARRRRLARRRHHRRHHHRSRRAPAKPVFKGTATLTYTGVGPNVFAAQPTSDDSKYQANWTRRFSLALPSLILTILLVIGMAGVRARINYRTLEGVLDLVSFASGWLAVLFGVFSFFGALFANTLSYFRDYAASKLSLFSLVLFYVFGDADSAITLVMFMLGSVGFAMNALAKVEYRFDNLGSKIPKSSLNAEPVSEDVYVAMQ